jgi:predicted house-cleaning noncanonical NTP pyrophosphatase (MazG superfamily)
MQTETISHLEKKLHANLLTDDDEERFNDLTEKYNGWFKEFIEQFLLEDMPEVHELVKEVLRSACIKEYLLHKEMIAGVERVLKRVGN